MQEGEHIVRRVSAINRPFLEEVAGTLCSLLKVHLLARLNIVRVDRNEVVPVGSCVLVDKT